MNDIELIKAEQLNANDDEVKLIEYLVNDRGEVRAGDPILIIETSKATQEITASVNGFVHFHRELGATIAIGEPIAIIGKTLMALDSYIRANKEVLVKEIENINATKKAIELAVKKGVDISAIQKDGIIKESDVLDFLIKREVPPNESEKNKKILHLSKIQKGMVKTLEISKSELIPAYLFLRHKIEAPPKDFISSLIYLASTLVSSYPEINGYYEKDHIVLNQFVNFGFTVDIEGNLYLAVIRDTASCDPTQIEQKKTECILNFYRNEISQEMLSEPSLCISYLEGDFLEYQIPVIFPKNSVMIGANFNRINKNLFINIAYDHRVISGQKVSKFAEEFMSLLKDEYAI